MADTKGRHSAPPSPRYLSVAGIFMGAYGLLTLLGFLLDSSAKTGHDILVNVGPSSLMILAALGLEIEQRWGWILTLLLALTGIGFGIYVLALPGDITELGVPFFAVFFLMLPGILLLWALFARRARSWLLRRPEKTRSSIPGRL